ncbi:MAG TPA: hypothetical protein VGY48_33365 [Vicinamibacterales bacterium]|jgi:hypothetical protein|nr:hypothetical protein [Vicinamibacterales bacterium]
MAIIVVPKPPTAAYNPDREPGTLLQDQLKHLEWAVRPAAERTRDRFQFTPARTEGEAARRIAALTTQLQAPLTRPLLHAARVKPPSTTGRSSRRGKARSA